MKIQQIAFPLSGTYRPILLGSVRHFNFLQGCTFSVKDTKNNCWYIIYISFVGYSDIKNTKWVSRNTQEAVCVFEVSYCHPMTFSRSLGYILSYPLCYT